MYKQQVFNNILLLYYDMVDVILVIKSSQLEYQQCDLVLENVLFSSNDKRN